MNNNIFKPIVFLFCYFPLLATDAFIGENCLIENIDNENIRTTPEELKLGVFYIQFADWENNYHARGSVKDIYQSLYYQYTDYQDQIFSVGTYKSEDPYSIEFSTTLSPDNRIIFGSFVDYWDEVSYGQFSLEEGSKIINQDTLIGNVRYINWLTAPYIKSHYGNQSGSTTLNQLYNSAITIAVSNGWMNNSADFDAYAIVYAGGMEGNGLYPQKIGNHFMVEERTLDNDNQNRRLRGIYPLCHEFGHILGLGDIRGGSNGDGLGDYSLMATFNSSEFNIAFERPPHLSSYEKILLGWLEPQSVSSDQIEYRIPNVEENQFALKHSKQNWTNEYFLIENRQPIGFDFTFQDMDTRTGGGILLYHKASSNFPNEERVMIIEADGSTDLFNEYGNSGDLADFFPGLGNVRVMNDMTIPSTNLQDGTHSLFSIYNISNTNTTMSADIYTNTKSGELSGIINENTLLYGNCTISNSLEILQGSVITLEEGASITLLNGNLIISGTEDERVTFKSSLDIPSAGAWQGIKVESGHIDMNYCDLNFADIGVKIRGTGTATIRNSSINNCNKSVEYIPSQFADPSNELIIENTNLNYSDIGVHVFGGSAGITQSVINANQTGILLEQSKSFKILDNTLIHNHHAAMVLRHSSGGIISGNNIEGNGMMAEMPLNLINGGIFLHASSPVLIQNTIKHNRFHGITAMNGSRPVMNYEQRGLNWIENNGTNELTTDLDAEIRWYDKSIPFLENGHNDIYDNFHGGFLLYGDDRDFADMSFIQNNYWADNDPNLDRRFFPFGSYEYHPYDTEPNISFIPGQFAGPQEMFNEGLVFEENEDWVNATQMYSDIITAYPEIKEAVGSVIRLFSCFKMIEGDFQYLQEYYHTIVNNYPDTPLGKTADQYSILCDVAKQEYEVAIRKYEAILEDPPSLQDSVYAVIDIGQVYLEVANISENASGRKASLGTMHMYEPTGFEDYESKVNNALAALMKGNRFTKTAIIPAKFSLYPSYPNPFNPTTTIRFDIPVETLRAASLHIYDITGRMVETLLNEPIAPGTHEITWNAESSSTGVYFIVLTNGNEQHVQKIVLMK